MKGITAFIHPLLCLCSGFVVVWPLAVHAESGNTEAANAMHSAAVTGSSAGLSAGYLMQLVAGLLFVVFCILLLAWLARRVNRFQVSAGAAVQVIGGLSMGARERVVLVQVGDEQILIGVAPGRVNKLHVLGKPVDTKPSTASRDERNATVSGFGGRLQDAMTRMRS